MKNHSPLTIHYSPIIAVFGGQGSQTDLAVEDFEEVAYLDRKYGATMEEVCEMVAEGECEYGILPTYNTQGGDVSEALEALKQFGDILVVQEQKRLIEHFLAGGYGTRLEDIQVVVSHWQALAQTKVWLKKNIPNASREPVPSTQFGCDLVANSLDNSIACVCPESTALDYDLNIIADHIEPKNNYTTFVLIQKKQ